MYKIDDPDTYYMMLPANLQNVYAKCFSYALSNQIHKLLQLADRLNVWGDLDHVHPKYYDYIAACIHIPYYRTEYANEKKLQLIKNAYIIYKYAGTEKAIEDMLNAVFDDAKFIRWDAYGGKPYHFKIETAEQIQGDELELFRNVLQRVKAERSIMDAMQTILKEKANIYIGGKCTNTYYCETREDTEC